MSGDLALLKLSESLSKGYLADKILTILYRIREGVRLYEPDRDFLTGLKDSFESYSKAPSDPFSFAINDSLIAEETPRPFTEKFIREFGQEDLDNFQEFSETLGKIIESSKSNEAELPSEDELKNLEDYFYELIEDSLSETDEIIPDTYSGEIMVI